MKKIKFAGTLFLMICLLTALSISVSAYQNQWVTVGKDTYYYGANGKKYTGGPKTILKNGAQHLYLFDSSGKLIKNKVTQKGKHLYLSLKNGQLLTGFKTINGKKYYGTEKGYLKTGLQRYNDKYYYFNENNGRALMCKWKKVGKYYYYFNRAGRAYHGAIYTINNSQYYFDKSAHRVSGLCKIKGYYYGFRATDGRMMHGWRVMPHNRKKYYFDLKTGRAYTDGFYKIDGKYYYFSKDGIRQKGWLNIGNKYYYLDPNNNGVRVYGKKSIGGTSFNFGSEGYITYHPTGRKTIRVNRRNCVVTVYDGNFPVKAMACSVGAPGQSTPTGVFFIQDHLRWWQLNGPSWGQYCSHFLPEYLFHSVPMYGTSQDPYNVRASDYNRLGQPASGGCIRLCVADAKWIYDNVPISSTVIISDSEPMPFGKPTPVRMRDGTVGKDPTDIWS